MQTGIYFSVTNYNNLLVAVGTSLGATIPVSLFVGFENYEPYLYMRIL